jgi:hypothetical protein
VPRKTNGERKLFLTNGVGTNEYPYVKKNNFDSYLTPHSKLAIDQNLKSKITRFRLGCDSVVELPNTIKIIITTRVPEENRAKTSG